MAELILSLHTAGSVQRCRRDQADTARFCVRDGGVFESVTPDLSAHLERHPATYRAIQISIRHLDGSGKTRNSASRECLWDGVPKNMSGGEDEKWKAYGCSKLGQAVLCKRLRGLNSKPHVYLTNLHRNHQKRDHLITRSSRNPPISPSSGRVD